jgi:acetate kinase
VLDTYFHRTLPEVATHMPIPAEYVAMGVRRYGYHGISYESIVTSCNLMCRKNLSSRT